MPWHVSRNKAGGAQRPRPLRLKCLSQALEAMQGVLHHPPHLFGMKGLHQVRRLTVFKKRFRRRTQGIARHEDEAGQELRLILRQVAIQSGAIEFRHAQIA